MISRPAIMGLGLALVGLIADQATKRAVLLTFEAEPFRRIEVTPFFDLVLVWNRGISYGLFQAGSAAQVWMLVGLMSAITLALLVWLLRNRDPLVATALGLLIGGAIGNTIDRAVHGAVVDFVSLHAAGFYWYVFNLADVWVVAGVALLLYDAFIAGGRQDADARRD
ncbi:MAG: signal peptidase II [Devosiaceae bacterium]|nr:signal peptidase II [Devosiaceae bacterium MH13]